MYRLPLILIMVALLSSCFEKPKSSGPTAVQVKKSEAQYQLLVAGTPYELKGAGINYPDGHDFEALKLAGGNTFRTWSTEYAEQELAMAKKLDLMVLVGIDLQKELHGFDYSDEQAVAKQFEWVKKQILKYKDHPNLLGWIVANEPNLLFNPDGSLKSVNPRVYQAISDIIDFIHEVDPSHPVTYSFAGIIPDHINTALQYTPQVDFISVQVYGGLANLQSSIKALNIDKAFMVTEFGPLGHWERPATDWGREIEEPGGLKARSFAERIQQGIANNESGKLIGHFAFEWGQKQERTPTWYGMFNKDGSASARIDELTKFWIGKYPDNRAPLVESISVNGLEAEQSVRLKPNQSIEAQVNFTEPDGDSINIQWKVLSEVSVRSQGGAFEQEPEQVSLKVIDQSINSLPNGDKTVVANLQAPTAKGDYRLFVYIYDGKRKVGNANFPFFIVGD